MRIIGVETSCDETALALLDVGGGLHAPNVKIIKHALASQVKVHRPFGGVVPTLAKREHLKNLPILLKKFSPRMIARVDMIAVTVGPGLEPALWTGVVFAKELALKLKKPVIGVNHLEGHLYSFLLPQKNRKSKIINHKSLFPAVALIVSGGHTLLLAMQSFTRWKKLGETKDDAVGEAFDKVARLLNLPYPGGPEIEKIAKRGNPSAIPFPRPMLQGKNFDFSFSGLKTAVLYYVRDHYPFSPADVAASFQEASIDVLAQKTMRAAKESGARSVLLSGGVAANKALRKRLERTAKKAGLNFLVPDFAYNTDNAVMIALAGYFTHLRKKKYKLSAQGNLSI